MSNHTPGPWKRVGALIREGHRTLATAWGEGMTGPEQHANARLITAAPELLQACINAEGWIAEHGPGMTELLDELEAAIEKATGS